MNNEMITALYTMMFVFVLFMGYKIFKTRKSIGEQKVEFPQKSKLLQYVLIGLLVAMMIMIPELYMKLMLMGIATYFFYASYEKISFSDTGIYFNGRFDDWEDIKQWTFDKKDQLVLSTSKGGNTGQRALPVRPEDKDAINKVIRSYKSKKKNRKS